MTAHLAPVAPDAPSFGLTPTAARQQAVRVVLWGTYDLGKPRTRILRDGLRASGAEVIEIHADIWSRVPDKSQLGKAHLAVQLLKLLLAYPVLVLRYLRAPAHDIVIVPYLGQFDVAVLWPLAKLCGKPVVLDLFLSLYDTVVNDRRMVRRGSLLARLLWTCERLACRAANLVLLDTQTHARRIAALLDLPPDHFDAVPVGAEPAVFPRAEPRVSGQRPQVLFYGQLSPLHGVETILEAALSPGGRAYDWHIIGSGQDEARVAAALADADVPHVTWDRWLPYAQLARAIAEADVCLGIFGTSDKAASVVPNKVYQALTAGRSVITGDTEALAEVFPQAHPALRRVPMADPDAILDAIAVLARDGFPAMEPAALEVARPNEIGLALRDRFAPLIGRG